MIELDRESFRSLRPAILELPINHLFARSVLEGDVDGRVWVDRVRQPALCHVVHPYGMTLMLARHEGADAHAAMEQIEALRLEPQDRWMQVYPAPFARKLDPLLRATAPPEAAPIEPYTRTNFRFDPDRYLRSRRRLGPASAEWKPRRLSAGDFALPGISVSPHLFWRDAPQFLARGGGWAIDHEGELAAMAFASFRFDSQLEIGVETRPAYRRRGLAHRAACMLIEECMAAGLEPVWSCRKENVGSYRLAMALGFEPTVEIPYYRLPGRGK